MWIKISQIYYIFLLLLSSFRPDLHLGFLQNLVSDLRIVGVLRQDGLANVNGLDMALALEQREGQFESDGR